MEGEHGTSGFGEVLQRTNCASQKTGDGVFVSKEKPMMQQKSATGMVITFWGLLIILVAYFPSLLAAKGGKPAPSTSSFGEPIIAFINSNSALMLLDADNNMKQLLAVTKDGQWISDPSWAPPVDGMPDRVAFSATLDDSWALYVIDADGQNLKKLAPIEGQLSDPVWSPDGLWIAYTASNPDPDVNDKDLFILDVACAETGSSGCQYQFVTPDFRENAPAWAPSSDRLVAKAFKYDSSTVELVHFDLSIDGFQINGFTVQVLQTNPSLSKPDGEGNLPSPAWSQQTEQWLAVLSRNADFSGDLFLVDTVTLEAFNLTNCPECDNLEQPSWSPCNSKTVVRTRDPQNKKNQSYNTLAFLDLQFSPDGPHLNTITYLPRNGRSDHYSDPAWKGGICSE